MRLPWASCYVCLIHRIGMLREQKSGRGRTILVNLSLGRKGWNIKGNTETKGLTDAFFKLVDGVCFHSHYRRIGLRALLIEPAVKRTKDS